MYSTVVWTNFWCLQHSSHNPRNYPFPSLLSFPSLHTPIQYQYQTVTQHRIWAKILKNSGIQGNCTTINSKGLNQGRVKQGYEANKKTFKTLIIYCNIFPFFSTLCLTAKFTQTATFIRNHYTLLHVSFSLSLTGKLPF